LAGSECFLSEWPVKNASPPILIKKGIVSRKALSYNEDVIVAFCNRPNRPNPSGASVMSAKQKAPCSFLGLGGALAIVARLKAGTDTILEAANGTVQEAPASVLESATVLPEVPPQAATVEKAESPPKPANQAAPSVVEPVELDAPHLKRRR
jgi:hypothetical protein